MMELVARPDDPAQERVRAHTYSPPGDITALPRLALDLTRPDIGLLEAEPGPVEPGRCGEESHRG